MPTAYRFVTVKPGALSLEEPRQCLRGRTHPFFAAGAAVPRPGCYPEMYFPGDPFFSLLIRSFNRSLRTRKARERLIARFDLDSTQTEWAAGYHSTRAAGTRATPFSLISHGPGFDTLADRCAHSSIWGKLPLTEYLPVLTQRANERA